MTWYVHDCFIDTRMTAWYRLQDYKTLYATMKRIADAEARDLDTWNIGITAGDTSLLAAHLPPLVGLSMECVHRSQCAHSIWLHMSYFCQSMSLEVAAYIGMTAMAA